MFNTRKINKSSDLLEVTMTWKIGLENQHWNVTPASKLNVTHS